MNFNQFASGNYSKKQLPQQAANRTPKPQTSSITSKNLDHYTDPYIRRYHITKIALKSLTAGLIVHLTKSIVENMRKHKFHRMSPWLEICVISGVFCFGIQDKFMIQQRDKTELIALRDFKKGHYFNSQYWH